MIGANNRTEHPKRGHKENKPTKKGGASQCFWEGFERWVAPSPGKDRLLWRYSGFRGNRFGSGRFGGNRTRRGCRVCWSRSGGAADSRFFCGIGGDGFDHLGVAGGRFGVKNGQQEGHGKEGSPEVNGEFLEDAGGLCPEEILGHTATEGSTEPLVFGTLHEHEENQQNGGDDKNAEQEIDEKVIHELKGGL